MGDDEKRTGAQTRHPGLTLLALSALIVILVVAVWALFREPPPLRVSRLPDGTVLRLEAITRRPQHRIVLGRPWLRLLATPLPPGTPARCAPTASHYVRTDPPWPVLPTPSHT